MASLTTERRRRHIRAAVPCTSPPSATSLRSIQRRLLRAFLSNHCQITTPVTCIRAISLTRPIRRLTRASIASVSTCRSASVMVSLPTNGTSSGQQCPTAEPLVCHLFQPFVRTHDPVQCGGPDDGGLCIEEGSHQGRERDTGGGGTDHGCTKYWIFLSIVWHRFCIRSRGTTLHILHPLPLSLSKGAKAQLALAAYAFLRVGLIVACFLMGEVRHAASWCGEVPAMLLKFLFVAFSFFPS